MREGAYRLVCEDQPADEDPLMTIIGPVRPEQEAVSEEHNEYLIQERLKRAAE